MLDVTVKRSEWGRGKSSKNSYLYNPQNGLRCCLGFVGNACGITDKQMENITSPSNLHAICSLTILDSLLNVNKDSDSNMCIYLIHTNDSDSLSETERESKLIEFGKEAGINFTFVD